MLNQLLAIGIASGIFIDDFRVRWSIIQNLFKYGNYLNPENFNLDDEGILDNYLQVFRSKILPVGYIYCDTNLLESYYYANETFSDEEIKELLYYWWSECGNHPNSQELLNRFFSLMESDLEGLLALATTLYTAGNPPLVLYLLMCNNREIPKINRIKEVIENYPPNEKAAYEKYKNRFLRKLKAEKKQLDQRKKHF